jgi:hypothetical protein
MLNDELGVRRRGQQPFIIQIVHHLVCKLMLARAAAVIAGGGREK